MPLLTSATRRSHHLEGQPYSLQAQGPGFFNVAARFVKRTPISSVSLGQCLMKRAASRHESASARKQTSHSRRKEEARQAMALMKLSDGAVHSPLYERIRLAQSALRPGPRNKRGQKSFILLLERLPS
jgi:hypothetical protein